MTLCHDSKPFKAPLKDNPSSIQIRRTIPGNLHGKWNRHRAQTGRQKTCTEITISALRPCAQANKGLRFSCCLRERGWQPLQSILKPIQAFHLESLCPNPLSTDLYGYCSSSGLDRRDHFSNSCDFQCGEAR